MRRFFIDKVENMRDIGGYSIGNNLVVKLGKIIRTNVITNLNEEELNEIKNMGFTDIIDLRSDDEVNRKNGVFFNNHNFNYNHIAINGDGKLPKDENDIVNTYMEMLEGKEQIRKIFEILSNSTGGVIYYCNVGKDRTGLITALILKLLGVDNKDIVADYIASGVFLEKKLKDYAIEINNPDILKVTVPKSETIFKVLENIDNEYGSIEGFLLNVGITKKQIEVIKEKYIE